MREARNAQTSIFENYSDPQHDVLPQWLCRRYAEPPPHHTGHPGAGALFAHAARADNIARARGMAQLAQDAALSRESLYQSLSGERAPSADTRIKVIHAMGFTLTVRIGHRLMQN